MIITDRGILSFDAFLFIFTFVILIDKAGSSDAVGVRSKYVINVIKRQRSAELKALNINGFVFN